MLTAESDRRAERGAGPHELDADVSALQARAAELPALPLDRRMELVDACAVGIASVAREWVETACEAKGIPAGSGARAEEITAGPVAVLRYLRLLRQTLADIRNFGRPRLPRSVQVVHGQLRVPTFPTKSLYDRLLFRPLTAETWLEPGMSHLFGGEAAQNVQRLTGGLNERSTVVVVLGAGNVSSIPATDALTKILQENKAVLLKMNPVNEYLGPLFAQALRPLVDAGLLGIVYGGADVGGRAVQHDDVDEVHITGSIDSHDAIVWGADPAEQFRRREAREPVLAKPITSELGNVTPWAIVPGRYSDAELRFQAEGLAASIVNNASFNCIATKVILTWKGWPERERFLDLLDRLLSSVPPRVAYYPGACKRFVEFSGSTPDDTRHLPWTLLRDADPDAAPHLFARESFVCVCAETPLEADSPEDFLARAVDFMNDRLWGTLAAAVTVPSEFGKRHSDQLDEALRRLRYGTIAINQWPGIAYALMSTPWGGHPTSTPADAQSGIGFVHNTFLLDRPEKTVLYCPLKFSPKPIWFPSHRRPEAVAWKLLELYVRPSVWRLPAIVGQAAFG